MSDADAQRLRSAIAAADSNALCAFAGENEPLEPVWRCADDALERALEVALVSLSMYDGRDVLEIVHPMTARRLQIALALAGENHEWLTDDPPSSTHGVSVTTQLARVAAWLESRSNEDADRVASAVDATPQLHLWEGGPTGARLGVGSRGRTAAATACVESDDWGDEESESAWEWPWHVLTARAAIRALETVRHTDDGGADAIEDTRGRIARLTCRMGGRWTSMVNAGCHSAEVSQRLGSPSCSPACRVRLLVSPTRAHTPRRLSTAPRASAKKNGRSQRRTCRKEKTVRRKRRRRAPPEGTSQATPTPTPIRDAKRGERWRRHASGQRGVRLRCMTPRRRSTCRLVEWGATSRSPAPCSRSEDCRCSPHFEPTTPMRCSTIGFPQVAGSGAKRSRRRR